MSQSLLDSLNSLGAFTPAEDKGLLDAAATAELEAANDAASNYVEAQIRDDAASVLPVWVGTTDLDDGETLADRLLALLAGMADQDGDDDLTPEEEDVLNLLAQAFADLLVSLGVTEDDAIAVLADGDDAAAQRIVELLQDQDLEDNDAIDNFVFGAAAIQSLLDSASGQMLDAVYRKKLVVRQGKKVRINKRISGNVRRSAAQKVAIRKAMRKAHSAKARMTRMKSMKARTRMGLNKK